MTHTNLAYYIFVRGFLQFGLLAATTYVLIILLWPGRTFAAYDLKIALAFPMAGLFWGFVMYFVDRRKRERSPD